MTHFLKGCTPENLDAQVKDLKQYLKQNHSIGFSCQNDADGVKYGLNLLNEFVHFQTIYSRSPQNSKNE
jgi:hypothetical protein